MDIIKEIASKEPFKLEFTIPRWIVVVAIALEIVNTILHLILMFLMQEKSVKL